jgi:hypothetical protein
MGLFIVADETQNDFIAVVQQMSADLDALFKRIKEEKPMLKRQEIQPPQEDETNHDLYL